MTTARDNTARDASRIDVISDVICPWCYIGKRQMERALPMLAAEGIELSVHWHPFQLNPDMPEGGVERAAYRAQKFGSAARARELDENITKAAAAVGLSFRTDLMHRTPNTIEAHRLIWLAATQGVQDAVVEALFDAYFTKGADIGDRATLTALGTAAGLTGVETFLAGDAGRREVTEADALARRSGIDGVPSFTMANHVLFSGAVPADTMAEAFGQAWRILSARAA
jgi:predicted DsbA family dithiol-disulfide isomerase